MPFLSKTNEPESPSFAESTPLEKRKQESEKINAKFKGDRIPIIVERAKSASKSLSLIDKKKYLVPSTMNFGQFVLIIRKRIKLTPDKSIFLYVNNVLPPATTTMAQLYKEHKGEDGFISCVYSNESAYGWGELRSPLAPPPYVPK